MLTAVLDTQLILRGATSAPTSLTSRLYSAWDASRFTLAVSEPILDEVSRVLRRAEVLRKLRMTAVEAGALLELLRRRAVLVTPTVRIARCRDPDDDKFLECAVSARADHLVSADADLLSLRDVEGIPIVDAPTFWHALASST